MLIIIKTVAFFAVTLFFFLFILSSNTLALEQKASTHEQLISQVESLFRENSEKLNYSKVVKLSNKIILQREKYSSEILAKTYLLLANVASNKGELETAYQFTQDGLAITTGDEKTKLCLQIKLASILSAKKEYEQLLTAAQQAIDMPQNKESIGYFLFALSYRSVAFAMLNQHEDALIDLQKVEQVIKQNPSFAEHISLLAILANAHYHLGDYQTALTMQLKILTLRFSLNKLDNVSQTYYHLANAYYRLNQFNDAYNAYWEAKKYAQKKAAPIYKAYASQGLGVTLMKQKQYIEAETEISKAKTLFYQYNLAKPYLETIISLAQLSYLTKQKKKAVNLLLEAEKLTISTELTDDYIILYQLLATIHKENKNISKAYFWQKKYSNALLKTKKTILSSPPLPDKYANNTSASNKTRQLAVKLAEQSELTSSFSTKYQRQQTRIFILSGITLLLLCFMLFIWLKYRAINLKITNEAIEKPNYIIAAPIQTKQLYQKNFDMARKYSYHLTVGYIAISNWQELTFQFNKKTVAEVSREIASLINEYISEFEGAGLINEGEYLLLFPHQHKDEVAMNIEKLVSALKLRSFANLGGFPVIIAYSLENPNFQDIDPYIFLSQLSDSVKIA